MILHLTRRAIQVLQGQRVDADLITLCGIERFGRAREESAVTENRIRQEIYTALEGVLNSGELRLPAWLGGTVERWTETRDTQLCHFCAVSFSFDLPEAYSMAVESLLSNGVERPRLAPYSRRPGESPTDLLVAWLRKEGPLPRHRLERFVWARAHPGDIDEVEDVDRAIERLVMFRHSAGMWGANWPGMVERGTLRRIERPGGVTLYAAP